MARSDIKIGDRYGMLTIVREVEPTIKIGERGYDIRVWNVECLCDCGKTRVLQFQGLKKTVKKGSIPSCGCRNIRFSNLEGFDRDETIVNMSKKEKREVIKKSERRPQKFYLFLSSCLCIILSRFWFILFEIFVFI